MKKIVAVLLLALTGYGYSQTSEITYNSGSGTNSYNGVQTPVVRFTTTITLSTPGPITAIATINIGNNSATNPVGIFNFTINNATGGAQEAQSGFAYGMSGLGAFFAGTAQTSTSSTSPDQVSGDPAGWLAAGSYTVNFGFDYNVATNVNETYYVTIITPNEPTGAIANAVSQLTTAYQNADTALQKALQTEIDAVSANLATLATKEASDNSNLAAQIAAMQQLISQAKSQLATLQAQVNGLPTSTSNNTLSNYAMPASMATGGAAVTGVVSKLGSTPTVGVP